MEAVNNGKAPKISKLEKINFVKQGKEPTVKNCRSSKSDKRWEGTWKIAADLDELLVFPLVASIQRPDLVMWCVEKRKAIVMELTVSWEENIRAAEERKHRRYRDLVKRCEEDGWDVEYYHIGIGARGYIERGFVSLLRNRFGFSQTELSKTLKDIQETVEKASMWLWLKRDDPIWSTSN